MSLQEVKYLKVQNSYIFLNSPYKKKDNPHTNQGNVIVLDVGRHVSSFIKTCFPSVCKVAADDDTYFYRTEYSCIISDDDVSFNVTFVLNQVSNAEYLDLTVEGKTETGVIRCLENVHNQLFSTDIEKEFIAIVTYDAVSEYYCNKILPKLNKLERNLRKLLFSTYIVNYGTEYYRATISDDMQTRIKGRIQAKGSEQKKEIKRLQEFFYSLELADIQKLLFTPQWTDVESHLQQEFLANHSDLSKLSDEQLRKAFNQFTPQSDWDRFFSEKIPISDIESTIDEIRQYRNKAAHFKFYSKSEYEKSKRLIKTLNNAVIRAIRITEEKDFAATNMKAMVKALEGLSKTMRELRESLLKTVSDSIASIIETSMLSISKTMDEMAKTTLSGFVSEDFTEFDEDYELTEDQEL